MLSFNTKNLYLYRYLTQLNLKNSLITSSGFISSVNNILLVIMMLTFMMKLDLYVSKCQQRCQTVDFCVVTTTYLLTVDIMTADILTVIIMMASGYLRFSFGNIVHQMVSVFPDYYRGGQGQD